MNGYRRNQKRGHPDAAEPPPATGGGFWTRQRMVLAALGAAVLAAALYFSLRPADPEVARLKEEFAASVGPASEEYAAQVDAALTRLETALREGFGSVAEEFAEICVNLDGVIERSKGEAEAKRVLTDSLRASVTKLVTGALEDFHASTDEARELLELRLLLSAPTDGKLAEVLGKHSLAIHGYAPQPPVDELRGGGFGKALDEGFSWVPLAGDAWDVCKLIFGDPRESGIRERARKFVHAEEARWLALVAELRTAAPDAATAQKHCRSAFKPKQALSRLAAE